MEILKQLGILTISSVSIVSLIGYISKNVFEKFLDAKLNSYKFKLEQELELFRNELKRKDFEYETKFSKLHLERAEIIKELYRKIRTFYFKLKGIHIYANTIPAPKFNNSTEINLLTELNNSYLTVSEFFDENRIMFPSNVQTNLNQLFSSYWEQNFVYRKLRVYQQMQEFDNSEELINTVEIFYQKLYEIHNEKIDLILLEIEMEFKKILGVDI